MVNILAVNAVNAQMYQPVIEMRRLFQQRRSRMIKQTCEILWHRHRYLFISQGLLLIGYLIWSAYKTRKDYKFLQSLAGSITEEECKELTEYLKSSRE